MHSKKLVYLIASIVFIAGALLSAEAPLGQVSPEACLKCHPSKNKKYKKKQATVASFTKHKHATLETGCESCHGDGAKHSAMKPKALTKLRDKKKDTFIVVNKKSELCAECHAKGGKDTITLASDLMVNPQQQYAEMKYNLHTKFKVTCRMCHDPHAPLKSKAGIRRKCLDCHKGKFAVPIEIAAMAGLSCEQCHMPKAVKNKSESKVGKYTKGDMVSHIFGITDDPNYKLNDGSGKVGLDKDGLARLTVEQTCYACHQSGAASEMGREVLLSRMSDIHPKKEH